MNPIVELFIRGSLLSLAGCLIVVAMRRRSPGERSQVIACLMVALIVLPSIVVFGPRWALLPRDAGQSSSPSGSQGQASMKDDSMFVRDSLAHIHGETQEDRLLLESGDLISNAILAKGLLGIYGLGAILTLLPIAMAWRRLARKQRQAHVCEDPCILRSARRLSGFREGMIWQLPGRSMPLTWGIVRPRIILPEAALQWDPGTLQAVLCHELAHVRRRDVLWNLLGQLTRALYWPQPLVWWLVRHWRQEAELACDDVAMQQGVDPHLYAEALYHCASMTAHHESGPAVPMAHPSPGLLDRRVRRVLAATPPNRHRLGKRPWLWQESFS